MRFAPLLAALAFVSTPTILRAQEVAAPALGPHIYSGTFNGVDKAEHGTLTLTAAPNGVILHVEVTGMKPGWHGMHFHEKGACDDEKFASAGGHVHSMTPVVHGFLSTGANDAGDLPNIFVAADGNGNAEVYSSLVTAAKVDDRPYLTDDDGSAVVIHDMPDDYLSQPIGNAGGRAVCAGIK